MKLPHYTNFGPLISTYTTVGANSANWILDGGNTKSADIFIGTNDGYNLNFETNNTKRVTIASNGKVGIGTSTPTYTLQISGNQLVSYEENIPLGVYVGGVYIGYPVDYPKDNRYEGFYKWNSSTNTYEKQDDATKNIYYDEVDTRWVLDDNGQGEIIAFNLDTSNLLVPPRFGWVSGKAFDIFDTAPSLENINYASVVKDTLSANLIYTNYIGNHNNFIIERLGLRNLTITDNEGWRGGRTTISNTLCVAPADPTNYFDQPNIFFSDAGLFHSSGPRASEEYRNISVSCNTITNNGADLVKRYAGNPSPCITLNAGPSPFANRNGILINSYTSLTQKNQSDVFLLYDLQDPASTSYGTIKIGKNFAYGGPSSQAPYVPITNARIQVDGNVNINGLIRTTVAADSLYTGNSNNWNSVYTSSQAGSGGWSSNYTSFNSNSGKYDSSWTTTNSNSANWTQIRSIQTSNFIASQGSYYIVNTTSTPITGALPASPAIGTTITFQDSFLQWQTNNFTLNRSGNMIQGLNENMICDRGGVMFSVTYIDGSVGWRVN